MVLFLKANALQLSSAQQPLTFNIVELSRRPHNIHAMIPLNLPLFLFAARLLPEPGTTSPAFAHRTSNWSAPSATSKSHANNVGVANCFHRNMWSMSGIRLRLKKDATSPHETKRLEEPRF